MLFFDPANGLVKGLDHFSSGPWAGKQTHQRLILKSVSPKICAHVNRLLQPGDWTVEVLSDRKCLSFTSLSNVEAAGDAKPHNDAARTAFLQMSSAFWRPCEKNFKRKPREVEAANLLVLLHGCEIQPVSFECSGSLEGLTTGLLGMFEKLVRQNPQWNNSKLVPDRPTFGVHLTLLTVALWTCST